MRPAPAEPGDVTRFAPDLLAFAESVRLSLEVDSFDLPGLRVELASGDAQYAGLCRRALIDSSEYRDADQTILRIVSLDYASHPEMPYLRIPGRNETPLSLSDLTAGNERECQYDVDYQFWQFFRRSSLDGVEAFQAPGHFPPWIESFPVRNFIHWAYLSRGWRMVHGGSLGLDGKGIMLAGSSGAGKSGTTLAGIVGGLDSVGDDYVTLEMSDRKITAYPVTRLMKQDAKGLARLDIDPATTEAGEPNWVGKYEFDFEVLGSGRRANALELQAIVIPRIARARRSTFTRTSSRVGMLAFAPSNLLQLPGDWRENMTFTSEVARRLPAYSLELSDDPAEIAGAIGEFIARGCEP